MNRVSIIEQITFDDGITETHSLYEWAHEYQLGIRTIYERYYVGVRGLALLAPTKGDTLTEEFVHRVWKGKWEFRKKRQPQKAKWVYVG